MYIGISLILCSLLYVVLLTIVYFSKQHLKTFESRCYSLLIITNILCLVNELACCFCVVNMDKIPIINLLVNRSFLIVLFIWLTIFTFYIFYISFYTFENKKTFTSKYNAFYNTLIVFSIVVILLLATQPISYYYDGTYVYSSGMSTNILFAVAAFYLFIWFFCVLKNIKNIFSKKNLPVFGFFGCIIITMAVRIINPGILLITPTFSFVTVLMYFTIENPDLQLVREYQKAKEYAGKSNDEKALFLFSLSQDIKLPVRKIDEECEYIYTTNDIEEIKDSTRKIKDLNKNISRMVNGVLDISRKESQNIKIHNTKYNIRTLFKNITTRAMYNLKGKNVEFLYKFDESIPEELLGDQINLKRIINIIIDNAIKYTNSGFVELNVTSLKKNNVYRLIINIEDSGIGMSSDVQSEIFDKEYDIDELAIDDTKDNLVVAKTLVSMIGGTILVSSEVGKGSKLTVVVDQEEVEEVVSASIKEIEKIETINNEMKLLIVTDKEEVVRILRKYFRKYSLNITILNSGQAALNEIRSGLKYKLILISEDLEKLSGYDTLLKLKQVDGFNTPVVVMAEKKDKDLNNTNYLEKGFDDFMIIPPVKVEVDEIINKYFS